MTNRWGMGRRGLAAGVALLAATLLAAGREARAYPIMVRHGYAGCAECHADPSGGGVLTDYGRGQAEILLRTPWEDRAPDWQPGKTKDFLFGAVELPDWLALQTDHRALVIPEPGNFRLLLMQEDLRGAVKAGVFRASGSVGYVSEGGQPAWITSNTTGGNLVSRDWWVGAAPSKKVLVRAGRMPLPFGIRSEEHMLYARRYTRTDVNSAQQVGLAGAWTGKGTRAEVMAVGGNLQVHPDAYRERGASGLVARKVGRRAEVGLSAYGLHAKKDVDLGASRTRVAQAAFARVAPVEPLVISAEADALQERSGSDPWALGAIGTLQADYEPVQGVHARATGEFCDPDLGDATGGAAAGWLSGIWFFAPHADLRLDALYGQLNCTPGAAAGAAGMAQVHFWL